MLWAREEAAAVGLPLQPGPGPVLREHLCTHWKSRGQGSGRPEFWRLLYLFVPPPTVPSLSCSVPVCSAVGGRGCTGAASWICQARCLHAGRDARVLACSPSTGRAPWTEGGTGRPGWAPWHLRPTAPTHSVSHRVLRALGAESHLRLNSQLHPEPGLSEAAGRGWPCCPSAAHPCLVWLDSDRPLGALPGLLRAVWGRRKG